MVAPDHFMPLRCPGTFRNRYWSTMAAAAARTDPQGRCLPTCLTPLLQAMATSPTPASVSLPLLPGNLITWG